MASSEPAGLGADPRPPSPARAAAHQRKKQEARSASPSSSSSSGENSERPPSEENEDEGDDAREPTPGWLAAPVVSYMQLTRAKWEDERRTGMAPRPYGKYYPAYLTGKGICMHPAPREARPSAASTRLCDTMLAAEYPPCLQLVPFEEVLQIAETASEVDETVSLFDLLIPGPWVLKQSGADVGFRTHCEFNCQWPLNEPMAGPFPRPTRTYGFTPQDRFLHADDRDRLAPFDTPTTPLQGYSREAYLPFFVVQSVDRGGSLDVADRQNSQSTSVAIQLLVSLYRLGRIDPAAALDREILMLSCSIDGDRMRLWGHYPVFGPLGPTGVKPVTFYRYFLTEFNFREDPTRLPAANHFTWAMYDHFVPKIHDIIRRGIDALPPPP